MGLLRSRKTTSQHTTMQATGLDNFLLLTDSYKVTHYKQYPAGTTEVYSYFESRGGKFSATTFFGLQYIIKRYFVGQVVTAAKIDEAERYYKQHLPTVPFNRAGWEHILKKHNGHLPLSIRAVLEGTTVDNRNVLMTVTNTDPECFWLTNYAETILVQVWYPMTVCTNSREQKKIIQQYLTETGDVGGLSFKLHDFGFRGVSSVESAAIGGAAHLVNFLGTDTIAALVLASEYYGEACAGFSIPASEHSTITAWGREGEHEAMRNMLEQYPDGLVACVSDSFDVFNACGHIWGELLKDKILSRDGTLVVRPDSGDPAPTVLKCLELLGDKIGCTTNEKGFKVLDPHVRVIQGDGISYETVGEILAALKEAGWSADNLAFGSGGALLQKLNRDTQKCAFKCSAIVAGGKEREVFKDPVTDPGKSSKKGRLSLVKKANGTFETIQGQAHAPGDLLVEVFRNGKLLVDQTFEEIRARAAL